jgi:hypothetical protein
MVIIPRPSKNNLIWNNSIISEKGNLLSVTKLNLFLDYVGLFI